MAKRIKKTESREAEICFVIMPFGNWFDNYYNNIFCPAIIKAGMTPRRADDLYRPSSIVQDIWALTKKAKIILADLSTKNPNVFYELGLAHALAKPAILITQTLDDVPFDLRNLRIIEYEKNDPNWGDKLMEKIEAAIIETIDSPNETIPLAFLDTTRTSRPAVTEEDKTVIEMKQDIEFLKNELTSIVRKRNNAPVNSIDGRIESEIEFPLLTPSPALAAIVGSKPITRVDVVKKVWEYIKKHGLQDKNNKRMINANEKLLPLFGNKNQVSMFDLAKIVNRHTAS